MQLRHPFFEQISYRFMVLVHRSNANSREKKPSIFLKACADDIRFFKGFQVKRV